VFAHVGRLALRRREIRGSWGNDGRRILMEGAVWSVPEEKILVDEEMARVVRVSKKHDPLVSLAISTAATSGTRLCETYHLRAEDILPDGQVRITSRKRLVLKPEVIEVASGLWLMLKAQAEKVKTGWLFPGGSQPCLIVRRPKFRVYVCPHCRRQIADPSVHKKTGDLKRVFSDHLSIDHKERMEDILQWIDLNSESVREVPVGCTGGHISGRHIQTIWKLATAEAGVMMRGRGFHTTRHYAITRYVEEHEGENPKEAQMFARHASLEMTMRYTHPKQLGKKVRAMKVVA
jgi:integrase